MTDRAALIVLAAMAIALAFAVVRDRTLTAAYEACLTHRGTSPEACFTKIEGR